MFKSQVTDECELTDQFASAVVKLKMANFLKWSSHDEILTLGELLLQIELKCCHLIASIDHIANEINWNEHQA